mmetsp:Transcript_6828/g.14187  ORF Transcript_6828/g.14187 Transcript_6828/m.14187 type:complete len:232 (+) Transcript_6828:211-906(+)
MAPRLLLLMLPLPELPMLPRSSKFISQSNSSSKWPSKGVSLLSARSTASGKPRSLAEPVALARPQAGGCLELVMKLSKLKNVGGLQLDTTLVRFSSSWKLLRLPKLGLRAAAMAWAGGAYWSGAGGVGECGADTVVLVLGGRGSTVAYTPWRKSAGGPGYIPADAWTLAGEEADEVFAEVVVELLMQQIDLRNISSSISLQVRRLRVFLFGLAAEPLGLGLFTPMFLEDSE